MSANKCFGLPLLYRAIPYKYLACRYCLRVRPCLHGCQQLRTRSSRPLWLSHHSCIAFRKLSRLHPTLKCCNYGIVPCLVTHALSYAGCMGLTCCIVLWNRVPRSLCCPLARVFASFCLKKYIVGYRVISGLTKRSQRLPSAFGGPTCFATSSHLYVAAQFVNVTKIPRKPRQVCCNLSKCLMRVSKFGRWILSPTFQCPTASTPFLPASTPSQSTRG